MNCIIIEDEAVAARRLKKLIDQNEVEVLAILHSVKDAISWFQNNAEPDIIFLDIQLGDGVSFEIFEEVNPKSALIFTTAYDEYALRAFKFNSIDYLLKPIQEKELRKSLIKLKSFHPEKLTFSPIELQNLLKTNFEEKYRERFLIKLGQKIKTIETKEMGLIFSENKGTYIAFENRNYPIDFSLDEVEGMLDPNTFYRISRQAIINLNHIQEMVSHSGSRLMIKIKGNQQEWVVSRERVNDFKVWLER